MRTGNQCHTVFRTFRLLHCIEFQFLAVFTTINICCQGTRQQIAPGAPQKTIFAQLKLLLSNMHHLPAAAGMQVSRSKAVTSDKKRPLSLWDRGRNNAVPPLIRTSLTRRASSRATGMAAQYRAHPSCPTELMLFRRPLQGVFADAPPPLAPNRGLSARSKPTTLPYQRIVRMLSQVPSHCQEAFLNRSAARSSSPAASRVAWVICSPEVSRASSSLRRSSCSGSTAV
mgnify:CR=1 FL=1